MAASVYNRKKKYLAPYAEGLVKQLTGFEVDHKDYSHVLDYVYTRIFEHTFATVDIASVQKSIDGIVAKFKIHGLGDRSARFKELVDKYVSSDTSQHTQLNVQWHVLLLLTKLSYRPTSLSEETLNGGEEPVETSETEEIINWPEYLKEGWTDDKHNLKCSDDGSEFWESASDEEEDETPHKNNSKDHLSISDLPSCSDLSSNYETRNFGVVPHPSLWRLPSSPSAAESRNRVAREAALAEQWLRKHVQNSWWTDSSCRSVPESKRLSANICDIWEKCKRSKEEPRDSLPAQQTHVISEFKVLKEVLWILQEPTQTSLFKLTDEGQFFVKPNVSIPSTIPDSLCEVLQSLCPYFTMIRNLRQFEDLISERELSESPPPVTYKAYCAAIREQLERLSRLAVYIEIRLNKQEETMTLLSVMEELKPALNFVQYLNEVHSRAVNNWLTQPAWLNATRLLSVLYEALLEATDQVHFEASLYIFIRSFHVYLDIIDTWLSEGRLEDWRKEFLVTREKGNVKVMPYEEEMKKIGVLPVSLLSKLVRMVRTAGHTMEVVGQLNKMTQLRDTVQNRGCLSKEFSENVYSEIKRLKEKLTEEPQPVNDVNSLDESENSNTSDNDEGVEFDKTTDSDEEIQRLFCDKNTSIGMFSVGLGEGERHSPSLLIPCPSKEILCDQILTSLVDNPLLSEALRYYLHGGEFISRPPAPTPSCSSCSETISTSSDILVSLVSIHSILEKQLDLIITRHNTASRLVTQTLRTEYRLLQHFTVLRTVFFMENGSLAQSFYSNLFREIHTEVWNDSVSLSVQLQLIVEEFYPGFGNYFSVKISSDAKNAACDAHKVIPFISLDYKVDWPVSLVISQEMINSYNKVFRFLLHLKYAFWTLHDMHFLDLSRSSSTLRVRQLQVLKCWMLYSTNTLHSYFMGLVLRSFSKHLDESTQLADSVHVIVEAHNKFLDEIKVHCLQDKKTYVETFIMKLLRLCSSLSDQWGQEAAGSLTDEEFQSLEEQYMIAYNGLVHCLDVLSEEDDAGNFLFELKSEISQSVPGSLSQLPA